MTAITTHQATTALQCLPRLASHPAWMLIDSGERDPSILKPRLTDAFIDQARAFVAMTDEEYRGFRSEDELAELSVAIGRYLTSASAGSSLDNEDFIIEMGSKFSKWPRKLVMEALDIAAQACPWPRDLPGWMSDYVAKRSQMASKNRDQAMFLIEVWADK